MIFLSCVIGIGMLWWTGFALAGRVVPAHAHLLRTCLGIPVGALVHALLLALLTLLGVPLLAWILLPLHGLLILLASLLPARSRPLPFPAVPASRPWKHETLLRTFLLILLVVQGGYAVTHAAFLPTYHIDSLTNWTMRAKVSWIDHALAFDLTEARGVAKPQYPFLVHGLQMMAHVTASAWSDRAAGIATLLLTVTSLLSLFVLLRHLRGSTSALLTVAAITHIPLLAFHLAQGYGDIHLVTYLLLGLGCTLALRITGDLRWSTAAALMVAAAAWTKTEGIILGLLPWLLLMGVDLPSPVLRHGRIRGMSLGLVLSLLFPLFLFLKGLPFTPHATDGVLGFHREALWPALTGFLSPSMGLVWPVILCGCALILWLWKQHDPRIDGRVIMTLFWGIAALLIVVGTYIFTPNARFLLDGESYFRQLLVPASLLLLSLGAIPYPVGSRSPQ